MTWATSLKLRSIKTALASSSPSLQRFRYSRSSLAVNGFGNVFKESHLKATLIYLMRSGRLKCFYNFLQAGTILAETINPFICEIRPVPIMIHSQTRKRDPANRRIPILCHRFIVHGLFLNCSICLRKIASFSSADLVGSLLS